MSRAVPTGISKHHRERHSPAVGLARRHLRRAHGELDLGKWVAFG